MDFALFLDFDGTLVEIAPRPEAIEVAPDLVDTLETLRRRLGGALALVSGRPIDQLDGVSGAGRSRCRGAARGRASARG